MKFINRILLSLALLAAVPQVARAEAAGASPARIWGLSYNTSVPNLKNVEYPAPGAQYTVNWSGGGARGMVYEITGWDVSWNHTGAGEFKSLGHRTGDGSLGSFNQYVGTERFAFVVPDDQVLVINEIGGNVSINGFPVGTSAVHQVYYLFAAGEVVQFTLANGASLSGFTGDPAFVSGGGASAGKKEVK
jgi:hypothetical protein